MLDFQLRHSNRLKIGKWYEYSRLNHPRKHKYDFVRPLVNLACCVPVQQTVFPFFNFCTMLNTHNILVTKVLDHDVWRDVVLRVPVALSTEGW